MGQSTEELTTQIAGTRESLAHDLDALQDRVSPSAIVERRKAAARSRVTALRGKVMGRAHSTSGSAGGAVDSVRGSAHGAVDSAGSAVEGSPLAAGLVAFGAGLVIAALIPASDAESRASQRVVDAAKDSGIVDEAKSVGQDVGAQLKDSATEAAQQVKATAQDSAGTVQQEGASSAEHVKSQAPGQ